MTEIIQILTAWHSPAGLVNGGEIVGVDSATAATLIADGVAVEYTTSAGAGVPVASAFRGIGAGELPSQYQALGGAADTTPSAAVEGYLNETTVLDGRAVPNSLVGDKLQG
jgi:hypothetical protein